MVSDFWEWIFFAGIVITMLYLDLFVWNKKAHEIKMREALIMSAVWIGVALLFNGWVFFAHGRVTGLNFFAGYLLEKSLSVDNLFVFVIIFSYFRVATQYQHRILFWGILGAIVIRAIFIAAGVKLIHEFEWVIYIFGAFLVYTGWKLAFGREKEVDPEKNPIVRLAKRFMPLTHEYEGGKFFIKRAGKTLATPLFLVLLVVETTDVVFALDSIPAILGITTDPFIVYTSNVFAILGLRALYFALAGFMKLFHYLQYGLSIILVFIGLKMLISHLYKIPIGLALGVIAVVLGGSVILSIMFPQNDKKTED